MQLASISKSPLLTPPPPEISQFVMHRKQLCCHFSKDNKSTSPVTPSVHGVIPTASRHSGKYGMRTLCESVDMQSWDHTAETDTQF